MFRVYICPTYVQALSLAAKVKSPSKTKDEVSMKDNQHKKQR